jgi:hypothetical protein
MSAYEQETHHEPVPSESGWHRINIGHLVMGVAFVGLTVVWVLVVLTEAVDITEHGWVMGLPWLVAGAVGLVASAVFGGRRHGHGPCGTAD